MGGQKRPGHDFKDTRNSGNQSLQADTKFKDGFELEKSVMKANLLLIEENPLAMRIFTHVA